MDLYSNYRSNVKLSYIPSKSKTLHDLAIEQIHSIENESQPNKGNERTLLVIGSKGVGKSLLISRFLDRDELPKPTLAMEYSYGRKTRKCIEKDICHIWELGGGTLLSGLLDAPVASMGPDRIKTLSVVLMLDLSAPTMLWFTVDSLLRSLVKIIHRRIGPDTSQYQESAWETIGKDHPDKAYIDPFPVPLIIVGGKYDLFRDFGTEKKQMVCRSLRFIAHTLGASLQFYSSQVPSLIRKARDSLNQLGFGTDTSTNVCLDHQKPLLIPAGVDSLEHICGISHISLSPPKKQRGLVGQGGTLDYMKQTFATYFSQFWSIQDTVINNSLPDDPRTDVNFREAVIDELRNQKDNKLQMYRDQVERRAAIRRELNESQNVCSNP